MKIKTLKLSIFGLLVITAAFLSVFTQTKPAFADVDSFCGQYSNKSPDFIAMCKRQYGYGQTNKNDSCAYTPNSERQNVCKAAYNQGKADKPKDGTPCQGNFDSTGLNGQTYNASGQATYHQDGSCWQKVTYEKTNDKCDSSDKEVSSRQVIEGSNIKYVRQCEGLHTLSDPKPSTTSNVQSPQNFCANQFDTDAEKAACQAGQNKKSCSTYANGSAEQTACLNGAADNLCGKMPTTNVQQGTASLHCYSDAIACFQANNGSNSNAALAACLARIAGIDQSAIGAIAAAQGNTGKCGRARTNLISCGTDTGVTAIGNVLKIALIILSVLVGIAAVGGIIYGGILYASAADNSGQISKAKEIIRNVVIGLLLYVFMVAITNWLIPGGVFT